MPPPRAILCDMCGKKFFKNSLAIHQKQCAAKKIAQTSFCEVCELPVSNDEYSSHVAECRALHRGKKKAKRKGPKPALPSRYYDRAAGVADPKTDPDAAKRALLARIGEPCDSCHTLVSSVACPACKVVLCAVCCDDIHDEDGPLAGHTVLHAESLPATGSPADITKMAQFVDNRVPCSICGRKFNEDRIAKHSVVCAKNATRGPRKKFMSGEEMRLKDTDFVAYKAVREVKPWVSRWREEHARMQAIVPKPEVAPEVKDGVSAGAGAAPVPPADTPAAADDGGAGPPGDSDAAAAGAGGEAPPPKKKKKKLKLHTGDPIIMDNGNLAWLRFKGPVFGLPKGTWYGVEYEEAVGKHTGCFQEFNYFRCPDGHGAFVRPDRVAGKRDMPKEPEPEPKEKPKKAAGGAGKRSPRSKPPPAGDKPKSTKAGSGFASRLRSTVAGEAPPETKKSPRSKAPPSDAAATGSGIRAVRAIAPAGEPGPAVKRSPRAGSKPKAGKRSPRAGKRTTPKHNPAMDEERDRKKDVDRSVAYLKALHGTTGDVGPPPGFADKPAAPKKRNRGPAHKLGGGSVPKTEEEMRAARLARLGGV